MRQQPHSGRTTYRRGRRTTAPPPPTHKGGGGKKALIIILALVFLLAAGAGTAFWLLGGMGMFATPPIPYTTNAEVRALRVEAPAEYSEAALRAYFTDAAAFASENGFNTIVFSGKSGLAVWWRDAIFPAQEEVAKNDGFFDKTDPLALLCKALEGRDIQLWLAVQPYTAAGYYPGAKGKAAQLAEEAGGGALLSFQPGNAAYEQLLAESLASLPKRYPLAGLVLEYPTSAAGPSSEQLATALPALTAGLNTALAEKGFSLPLLLAYDETAGALPAEVAAELLADGSVSRLLASLAPGQGLSARLQLLVGQASAGSLLPVHSEEDSAAQVLFTARQSPAFGGALLGSWPQGPENAAAQAGFAFLEGALTPADGSLPLGFDIPKLLAINFPQQNYQTTFEQLFVMGTSNPELPLTLDGAEIPRAVGGAFGVLVNLEEGENEFSFAQGPNALTLKVERVESTGGGGTATGDGTRQAPAGQAMRVSNTFAGALAAPGSEGEMNETLPAGAVFVVRSSARIGGANRWAYEMPSGDWVSATNAEWIDGNGQSAFTGISARAARDGGEYLDFEGSGTPAAYVGFSDETAELTLTFYDTTFTLPEGFSSTLVSAARIEENAETGSVSLILQTQGIWGYNIEYDTEANTTRLYLKKPPQLSANAQKPLTGVRVMIDSGHGGDEPGAPGLMGDVGPNEKHINLALGQAIAYRLRQLGATVLMTREDDSTSTTMQRLILENTEKPDFYLAVHHDSVEMNVDVNTVNGISAYYYHPYATPPAQSFAQNLLDNVAAATGRTARNDGSAEWNWFNVNRTTVCPSVLFEYGFITNPAVFEEITSTDGLYAAACGTANAILQSIPG